MKKNATKAVGDFGERRAAIYLLLHGYFIKARNYRSGKYEIDIVAENRTDVIFAEVKTRVYSSDNDHGTPPPRDAIHAEKQKFTRTAALHYLNTHSVKKQPRMDVIEVYLLKRENKKKFKVLKIRHIKAAY